MGFLKHLILKVQSMYEPVKQSLGGGLLFFISAIAYLISLRALGYLLTNKFNQPEGVNKK